MGGATGGWRRRALRQLLRTLRMACFVAVMMVAVRATLIEAYRIPTSSMENTLLVGDFLLVNKAVFGTVIPFLDMRTPSFRDPERGEVIVFHPPHDPQRTYVKRVVGVPGDVVHMEGFEVRVNGDVMNEPYAHYDGPEAPGYSGARVRGAFVDELEAAPPPRIRPDTWGPIVVPDGKYFVLGDNRDNSEDSRFWGFVDRDEIRGRPLFVYYSARPDDPDPEHASDLASPEAESWWARVRWHRFGAPIR